MYQFIESICFKDKKPLLLEYHQTRLERAFASHYPPVEPHELSRVLRRYKTPSGMVKARVLYDSREIHVEFVTYQIPRIHSLKVVESQIDYEHKFFDRTDLNLLHADRGDSDDILILKNGRVTDSYYANCAFYDGSNWFTPDTFLLDGIKRKALIDQGFLKVQPISKNDMKNFEKVSLINAMLDLGQVEIPIQNIRF